MIPNQSDGKRDSFGTMSQAVIPFQSPEWDCRLLESDMEQYGLRTDVQEVMRNAYFILFFFLNLKTNVTYLQRILKFKVFMLD